MEIVNGFTFDQWIAEVDSLFRNQFWMSYVDFPDWCYYDDFVDGMTPKETFEAYREEMGY